MGLAQLEERHQLGPRVLVVVGRIQLEAPDPRPDQALAATGEIPLLDAGVQVSDREEPARGLRSSRRRTSCSPSSSWVAPPRPANRPGRRRPNHGSPGGRRIAAHFFEVQAAFLVLGPEAVEDPANRRVEVIHVTGAVFVEVEDPVPLAVVFDRRKAVVSFAVRKRR